MQRVIGERHPGPGVPGLLTGEGVGAPVWENLSEDAAARIRKAVALARATDKPVTAEIATVTATTIRYDEVRHVPRGGGTLLLIVRDVTESRRAARELAERDRTMQTLLANIPGMAYRCANDADWTTEVLSHGCRRAHRLRRRRAASGRRADLRDSLRRSGRPRRV